MMGQPSKHTRHNQVVHTDTRTSTNISSIATTNPPTPTATATATATVPCSCPNHANQCNLGITMAGTVHRRTQDVPTRLGWLAGWLAGWVAPVSVYDGPLYHLQIRPDQTRPDHDATGEGMPGQAKDRISQPFREEPGRVGGSCVSCALQVASQTGVCLPRCSCLEGLMLRWGRRGGKRVLQASLRQSGPGVANHRRLCLDRARQGGR
jgi:hypothetical protein